MRNNIKENNKNIEGEVLVCVPRTNDGGGANYFNSLKYLLSPNVVYFYRGKPGWPVSRGFIHELFRLINDYISYIYILLRWNYKIVHINTFFGGKGIYRDAIFIIIAKLLQKKIIVFFRGWDWNFSAKKNSRLLRFIKNIFLKSDALIVLSSDEKRQLRFWGYNNYIFSETTTVDENLIKEITIDDIKNKYDRASDLKLLFLSRIHKEKGIYETIDAFQKLVRNKFPNLQLIIAGQGPEHENIKRYIANSELDNIKLIGFVSGEEKKRVFQNAHIFLFPSFSEGMPNAVLEAFAFGLPVVATKVGGLKDIFKDRVNGFFVEIKNADDLEEKLNMLISNPALMREIAANNYNYARNKFISSVVAKRLEKIYCFLLYP